MTAIELISPIDGSTYKTIDRTTPGEAAASLELAKNAQADWAETPLHDRMQILERFIPAIEAQADRISLELTWQMGRPIRYGPNEIGGVVERTRGLVDVAPKALAPITFGDGGKSIDRVPHGVALIVAPWNYPYLTAVNAIVPALLSGNAVILKPASQTALTGERFAEALATAGLPDGLFQCLHLEHDQIDAWLKTRAVDFVSFTGSVRAGVEIEHSAAGRFLPMSFELGGKDPAYVRGDADVANAAENLVDGSFFNSGQSCCGIERIYVDRKIYGDFIEQFRSVMDSSLVLGNPTEESTTLGPVVSTSAASGIRQQVSEAIDNGAVLLGGGMDLDGEGPYLAATALTNVDHSMKIMVEETFGPSVGIMPVDGDDEALSLMNDSKFGLTASIWSNDKDTAMAIGRKVRTGTVFFNRCDYLDPQLAWVGVNESGRGCSLSELGFHQVTRPKSYNFPG